MKCKIIELRYLYLYLKTNLNSFAFNTRVYFMVVSFQSSDHSALIGLMVHSHNFLLRKLKGQLLLGYPVYFSIIALKRPYCLLSLPSVCFNALVLTSCWLVVIHIYLSISAAAVQWQYWGLAIILCHCSSS